MSTTPKPWSHPSFIVTWPYFRALESHTYTPVSRIWKSSDKDDLKSNVEFWKEARIKELDSVTKAGTLSAAATIGVFSWSSIPQSFWVAQAFFYTSLLLSITAVVTAAQQTLVIHSLSTAFGPLNLERSVRIILGRYIAANENGNEANKTQVKQRLAAKNMLYVWQCPLMLMSYAWVTFLVALTVHVCTPLIRYRGWNDGVKVAIFYLAVTVVLHLNFVWSSAFTYWNPPDSPPGDCSPAVESTTPPKSNNQDVEKGHSQV